MSNNIRYRRIYVSIHDDPWYRRLSPGARNLYMNLIPLVGTSGAKNASIRLLTKLCGYNNCIIPMWLADILTNKYIKELADKVIYWPDEEVVWIKNFTKLQGAGSKFITGGIKHAQNFPDNIQSEIIPYLTSSNGVSDRVSDGA